MASVNEVDALKSIATSIKSIDRTRLLRPQLGALALSPELDPLLTSLFQRVDLALEVAADVPDNIVQNFRGTLQPIYDILVNQSTRTDTDYASQRAYVLQTFQSHLSSLLQYWPNFVVAAIDKKGLLKSEEAFQQGLKNATDQASQIVEEAKQYARDLHDQAKSIEAQARSTAAGVSFQEVQEEFRSAQKNLFKKVLLWGGLSGATFICFILFAWYIVQHPPLLAVAQSTGSGSSDPSRNSTASPVWLAVYLAAIRITILTAIGAATTFFLRMFRAHLHMNEYNLHRRRVVNSLPVLVQAAETPEQRDQIRGRLIDLVTGFGNSGLLNAEDDSFSAPKMTIDAVMKNLSGDK